MKKINHCILLLIKNYFSRFLRAYSQHCLIRLLSDTPLFWATSNNLSMSSEGSLNVLLIISGFSILNILRTHYIIGAEQANLYTLILHLFI